MKLDPYLIPLTEINSKWITDLNAGHKMVKLLEEDIQKNLNTGFGNDFLDMTPKSISNKNKCQ